MRGSSNGRDASEHSEDGVEARYRARACFISLAADSRRAEPPTLPPSIATDARAHGWTDRELAVASLAGRGAMSKEIAYELGISESSVSVALASAANRLGLSSSTRVAAWVSRSIGIGPVASIEPLTNAERAVLALVREGLTNAEIAAARGTSSRTIANQIASLLRKMRVSSRRGLAALRTASDENAMTAESAA